MKLSQLLARLSRGPLSNLSMSNDGDGTIIAARQPAFVDYINDGLLQLHSQFVLIENELIIEEQEGTTTYKLHSDYSMETGALPLKYIRDSAADPYTNDLIKILAVYRDNTLGGSQPIQVALNDATKDDSVYTPKFDVLQIPDPVQDAPLYLLYQAKHPELVIGGTEEVPVVTLTQDIFLPDVLVPALIEYVSYKVYTHMNGQEHTAKAKEHFDNYRLIVGHVEDKDLVNSSLSNTNTKFNERGWK
jgi:hypothetical protein